MYQNNSVLATIRFKHKPFIETLLSSVWKHHGFCNLWNLHRDFHHRFLPVFDDKNLRASSHDLSKNSVNPVYPKVSIRYGSIPKALNLLGVPEPTGPPPAYSDIDKISPIQIKIN